MAARTGLLKLVPVEEPPGDAEKTRERASQWSEGQKKCRRRKRHNWVRYNSVIYGKIPEDLSNLPAGTRINIIERCPDCRNRREADHVISRRTGVLSLHRADEKWRMIYLDIADVPYLLDKGSQPVSDDLRDEMYAEEFFAHSGKLIYVDDDADD